MSMLDISLIRRTRQHHALEHATIHVLNMRFPALRLIGWSSSRGFYIHGPLSTDQIRQGVAEALTRLRRGETHLAVHPRCGTNLVTSATLVGLVAFAAMLPGDKRSRRERLPTVLLLSTLASLAAQPIGLLVQQYLTTEPRIASDLDAHVEQIHIGRIPVHRVQLVPRARG